MTRAGPEPVDEENRRREACGPAGHAVDGDGERDPFLAHRDADRTDDDLYEGDW